VTILGDDGGEEQNDEEDAEEEEDGDGLDDVLRDSDLLSDDDDEQLRIAMALSLSSLRREQKQQQQAQRSEQPAPLPQLDTARSSAEAGLEVDASGKCSRSGVKCADSRPVLGKCDCGHYTVGGC
jgi:hypothetical protein